MMDDDDVYNIIILCCQVLYVEYEFSSYTQFVPNNVLPQHGLLVQGMFLISSFYSISDLRVNFVQQL